MHEENRALPLQIFITSHAHPSPLLAWFMAMDAAVVVPGSVNNTKGSSSDEEGSVVTEEEKDMAECLIMLASGGEVKTEVGGKRKLADMSSGCYQCRTCDKTFASFQALGGHRAGHRKANSRSTPEREKLSEPSHSNCSISLQHSTPSPNNNNSSSKEAVIAKSLIQSSKPHQCSICGSEFSSGQALGGHMRRHRSNPIPVRPKGVSATASSFGTGVTHYQDSLDVGEVRTRSLYSLDLNLPAPEDGETSHQQSGEEDDQQNAAFHHRGTVFFSAHTIVGCQY